MRLSERVASCVNSDRELKTVRARRRRPRRPRRRRLDLKRSQCLARASVASRVTGTPRLACRTHTIALACCFPRPLSIEGSLLNASTQPTRTGLLRSTSTWRVNTSPGSRQQQQVVLSRHPLHPQRPPYIVDQKQRYRIIMVRCVGKSARGRPYSASLCAGRARKRGDRAGHSKSARCSQQHAPEKRVIAAAPGQWGTPRHHRRLDGGLQCS